MTMVTIEKELAENLITSKMANIKSVIEEILQNWNETDVARFLLKAKEGTLKNAEDDAIDLRQLLLDYEKLKIVLNNL